MKIGLLLKNRKKQIENSKLNSREENDKREMGKGQKVKRVTFGKCSWMNTEPKVLDH
jgi:hypothetical protein